MTIKQGYDSKPTQIRVNACSQYASDVNRVRMADLWIEQEGVERISHGFTTYMKRGVPTKRKTTKIIGHSETLAFITLEELLDLRDELNSVIRELVA